MSRQPLQRQSCYYSVQYQLRPATSNVALYFHWTDGCYMSRQPLQHESCYYTIHYYLRPPTSSFLLYLVWTDGGSISHNHFKLQYRYYTKHYHLRPATSTVRLYKLLGLNVHLHLLCHCRHLKDSPKKPFVAVVHPLCSPLLYIASFGPKGPPPPSIFKLIYCSYKGQCYWPEK
jgi:hypothetical protein